MHESCHLHVEAAILRNLEHAAFAPPANRIEPGGSFLDAQSRVCDGVETESVAQSFLHIYHQIGSLEFCDEVEDRVAHQNLVIEVQHIEADDEIGPTQSLDQSIYLRLTEDFVATGGGAEDNSDRHAHVALARPSPRVIRSPLGLEVEVNDVARHLADLSEGRVSFQFKTAAIKTHHLIHAGHSELLDHRAVVLENIERA